MYDDELDRSERDLFRSIQMINRERGRRDYMNY